MLIFIFKYVDEIILDMRSIILFKNKLLFYKWFIGNIYEWFYFVLIYFVVMFIMDELILDGLYFFSGFILIVIMKVLIDYYCGFSMDL